jgi:hypothetical protein
MPLVKPPDYRYRIGHQIHWSAGMPFHQFAHAYDHRTDSLECRRVHARPSYSASVWLPDCCWPGPRGWHCGIYRSVRSELLKGSKRQRPSVALQRARPTHAAHSVTSECICHTLTRTPRLGSANEQPRAGLGGGLAEAIQALHVLSTHCRDGSHHCQIVSSSDQAIAIA